MKLLLLADLHNRVEGLRAIAEGHDVALLAGDIANFGGLERVRQILITLEAYCPVVLGIPGNCDPPEVRELLKAQGMLLNGTLVEQGSLSFVGLGGTEPAVFNRENEYLHSPFLKQLKTLKSFLKESKPFIFVSHQPPFGTSVDRFANGEHTGSLAIRNFLEETQPLIAVSGHIHEAVCVDRIGKTLLVNPGPFKNGFYATAYVEDTSVEIDLRSL